MGIFLALLLLLSVGAGVWESFPDLEAGAWYETAVQSMLREGILSGFPDGSFRPDETITAGQYVAVLGNLAGLTPAQPQVDHWASPMAEAARAALWYDWDELPPSGEGFDRPITRQLAVKMMVRALFPQARGDYLTQSGKIRDFAQLDGRYYEPVLAAYELGLVRGDEKGNFRPREGLTRAQAASMLYQAGKLRRDAPPELSRENPDEREEVQPPQPQAAQSGGVSQNGWLQVLGTQLCNERGEPLQLRGMSSHGLQWFPQYASRQAIGNTAAFGANLFRAAMYTGEGGYLSDPERVKAQLIAAVDAAIAEDIYVIIDWHILSDGNPSAHTREAVDFFREMARRYGDSPAVLFEICNEPNGDVQWARDVKPYAQILVENIRAEAPRSVILIGSPTWSQDVHLAAADPVEGENLMYTLHFYAGTHGQSLRDRASQALAQGLPLFVSEWGTSRADGGGGVYPEESERWLDFLEKHQISWANWSLCDKEESSAALKPHTPADRPWTQEDLTPSGALAFSHFAGS